MDTGVLPPEFPGWDVGPAGGKLNGVLRNGKDTDKVSVREQQGQSTGNDHSMRMWGGLGRDLGWILGKLGMYFVTNLRAGHAAYAFLDVGGGGAGFVTGE